MHINISSIQSFKKEKKQYILPHYHNSIELIYVLDGCLHCLIQGKKYTINKDHLCIINQNHIHRIDYDKENNCDFRIIMIDSSFWNQIRIFIINILNQSYWMKNFLK